MSNQEYYDPGKRYRQANKSLAFLAIIFIIALCVVFFKIIFYPGGGSDSNSDLVENANYHNLMIQFDDDKTFSSALNYPEKDTPSYKWAAAATSIYSFMGNGNEKWIGGQLLNSSQIPDCKEFLDKAYKISDRKSAKEVVDRMIKYGHRARYRQFLDDNKTLEMAISLIEKDKGKDLTYEDGLTITVDYFKENGISTESFLRVKGSALAYLRFGDSGIDGYDYLRLIRVSYMCYKCGYLSQREYMQLINNLNDELRREYKSFRQIHECYYYGEMFRLGDVSDASSSTLSDIEKGIARIEKRGYYDEVEPMFFENDPHTDKYYQMTRIENVDKLSETELSDDLEDYTFEINGIVYKLPVTYRQMENGGFVCDSSGDTIIPAGEEFYFEGYYLGNEYSGLDFGVYNNLDHDAKLSDLQITLVNGNIFRWNKYQDYPYKIAKGIEVDKYFINEVERKFGQLSIPEDHVEDVGGGKMYYYEYRFDSGFYRFMVQESGRLAGIRMCRYHDESE
ncbi:MAG: DUF1266 domain-containing protein [Butyrivibrio sp.]|nr:DUF1266 domain-containing protein [Butyrivibrio sp.]